MEEEESSIIGGTANESHFRHGWVQSIYLFDIASNVALSPFSRTRTAHRLLIMRHDYMGRKYGANTKTKDERKRNHDGGQAVTIYCVLWGEKG